MNNFTLCKAAEKALPAAVESADGSAYPIDPCFRTVLSCLRVLADPDASALDKGIYVSARFFLNQPPPDMWDAFQGFISGEKPDSENDDPVMDFEVDAGAIYASFRQQYGIDLLRTDLHWFEFMELVAGLADGTAFSQRVRIRTLDESKVAAEDRSALRRAKSQIAIARRESQRVRELKAEIEKRLDAGQDVSDLVEQLETEG